MYIKFDERENGRKFTFFEGERLINGNKVSRTDKCIYGTLSEGIKTGEENGSSVWTNDYWRAIFCGKALDKAAELKSLDRICVVEMNIRNIYSKASKKSYPQIMVTDFDIVSKAVEDSKEVEMLELPEDDELPFV